MTAAGKKSASAAKKVAKGAVAVARVVAAIPSANARVNEKWNTGGGSKK
jgi:hypothetical protein